MKTQNKRILHVITLSSVGGAQSVVVNLANAQCKENDVYVLSSSSCEAWKALDPEVHVLVIKEIRKEIGLRDIMVFLKLLWWRFKLKPDVIQLHSSKMGMFGRLVFPRKKTIYTVHGFDSMRVANRKLLFIEKLLKNRCRFIVGVSKYDEVGLNEEGITKNVTYVYNGVKDFSNDIPSEQNQALLSQMTELKSKYKGLIISIARDDTQKKIDLFLDIAKQMPEYAFVWVGNSQDHPKTGNVLLMGQIPMGYQLLAASDIFILCSNYEGLPMSIIEALSFSKPVVSSKVGGVTEILNGKNGFAVDNNVEDFTKAIRKILDSDEVYQSFSKNARKTYEDDFVLDKMVEGYDDLYATIVSL